MHQISASELPAGATSGSSGVRGKRCVSGRVRQNRGRSPGCASSWDVVRVSYPYTITQSGRWRLTGTRKWWHTGFDTMEDNVTQGKGYDVTWGQEDDVIQGSTFNTMWQGDKTKKIPTRFSEQSLGHHWLLAIATCYNPRTPHLKGILTLTILCTKQFSSAQTINELEMDNLVSPEREYLLLISLPQTEMWKYSTAITNYFFSLQNIRFQSFTQNRVYQLTLHVTCSCIKTHTHLKTIKTNL